MLTPGIIMDHFSSRANPPAGAEWSAILATSACFLSTRAVVANEKDSVAIAAVAIKSVILVFIEVEVRVGMKSIMV